MITLIVTFPLSPDIDLARITEMYKETAPKYRAVTGLIRKHYVFNDEAHRGGAAYLFKDMASVDAFLTDDFIAYVTERYGAPDVQKFTTPVAVDNETGKIITAD